MTKYTTTFQPSYWDPVLMKYLGLVPEKPYYKSYIFKCLANKLTLHNNNRYEFDTEFINIIKEKLDTIYVWSYGSRYSINNLLNIFKSDIKIPCSEIFMIDFQEVGNNIQVLSI